MPSSATQLVELHTRWDGFPGSPGFSTFFWDEAVGAAAGYAAMAAFFRAQINGLPGDVALSFPNSGFIIDVATGHQTGTWSVATPEAPTAGTDHVPYIGVAGYTVNWRTGDLSPKGRQIQGRTFMVPAAASAFDLQGRLSAAFHTAIVAAAEGFRTAGGGLGLHVYHRPAKLAPGTGTAHLVIATRVAQEGQFLTSRRQ